MFKSIIKIGAATILFAVIHSSLASRYAKTTVTEIFGENNRNGLYRPIYNSIAVISFGALVIFGLKLPNRQLYKIPKPFSLLTLFIQACFLFYLVNGAKQIGFVKFSGITNLIRWFTGQSVIEPEPEGQGPVIDVNDEIKATGPFRTTRHPLNFGMLPILWLMPEMTVNLATFNILTTFYLIIGSIHEEIRLKESYGNAYIKYQKSGINFFVPMQTKVTKLLKLNNLLN